VPAWINQELNKEKSVKECDARMMKDERMPGTKKHINTKSNQMLTAQQLVELYNLQPHPEGGYFKETYRATESINAEALPKRFTGDRRIATGIYFLLEGEQFSAFHRIKSDEMWHFYAGHALNIYVIHLSGELEIIRLGSDVLDGQTFQAVVPANCWFASRPAIKNTYSFVGCTVAPGFDFEDFEMADKISLSNEYPRNETLISALCR
jgi:predicted cupin superfamily sugar epimerase